MAGAKVRVQIDEVRLVAIRELFDVSVQSPDFHISRERPSPIHGQYALQEDTRCGQMLPQVSRDGLIVGQCLLRSHVRIQVVDADQKEKLVRLQRIDSVKSS